MNKISLDSPELSDSVRWQDAEQVSRQDRRDYLSAKASEGIKNRSARRNTQRRSIKEQSQLGNKLFPGSEPNHLHKPEIAHKSPVSHEPQVDHKIYNQRNRVQHENVASGHVLPLARAVTAIVAEDTDDPYPYRRSLRRRAVDLITERTRNFKFAMTSVAVLFAAVLAFNMFLVDNKPSVLGATDSLNRPIPGEPVFNATLASSQIGTRVFHVEDTIASYIVSDAEPRFLAVPKHDIMSRVFRAGTSNTGSVTVPGSIHDVIWYDGSTEFIESSGAALIVGHSDGLEAQGVFSSLKFTKYGDTIEVIK